MKNRILTSGIQVREACSIDYRTNGNSRSLHQRRKFCEGIDVLHMIYNINMSV